MVLVWIGLLIALVALLRGADREHGPVSSHLGELVERGDAAGFNLLLISLDTVRQDRLGCYGYRDAKTPVIDRLATRGVRFGDAVSSSPVTLPSHTTLLTGLYPPTTGVRDNGLYRLAEEHQTLAERLEQEGYRTAAFIGCFVLDARFGLDQGFGVYDFAVTAEGHRRSMPDFNERPAEAVTDAAIRWLRDHTRTQAETPLMMWVHYFDPHLPYRSPLQNRPDFAGRPYDAEIAWVDQQLGRLLSEFERLELTNNTLVVLVADHGESLGEHGEPTHGMFLYEATLRVPLIVSSEALFSEAHVEQDRVVGLVDVRPTIEALLGLEVSLPADGISLLEPEAEAADRAIYLETFAPRHQWGWSPLYGLRTRRAKYILAPTEEFYDLGQDPGETDNLDRRAPARKDGLRARLMERMASWEMDDLAMRRMSDEEIERLSSLGYVHHAAPAGGGGLQDPKDMMPLYNRSTQAEKLYAEGRYAEAAAEARAVVSACPTCIPPVRVLAFSLIKLGQAQDAIELLRDSVERNPDTFLIRSLAQAMILDERYDEVEQVLAIYAEADPADGRVPLLRGDVKRNLGDMGRAREEYNRAIALDEHRVGLAARERIARIEDRERPRQ